MQQEAALSQQEAALSQQEDDDGWQVVKSKRREAPPVAGSRPGAAPQPHGAGASTSASTAGAALPPAAAFLGEPGTEQRLARAVTRLTVEQLKEWERQEQRALSELKRKLREVDAVKARLRELQQRLAPKEVIKEANREYDGLRFQVPEWSAAHDAQAARVRALQRAMHARVHVK